MSNVQHPVVDKDGFRLRGIEMSRIDAFSDVVFGFALTLLVVSLEVPKTFDELHTMLLGFVPFAICFYLLIAVWMEHYRFFRRFGLHDWATIRLNCALLFVVLFYVYPLKFLFTMVASPLLGRSQSDAFSNPFQERELMLLFGVGLGAIFGLFALLNYQAWRQREHLELSPVEQLLTRSYVLDASFSAAIGALSCGVAFLLPLSQVGWAGLTFLLIWPYKIVETRVVRRKLVRLHAAQQKLNATEAEEADLPVVDTYEV
jgi:uncharacterized membrane protein